MYTISKTMLGLSLISIWGFLSADPISAAETQTLSDNELIADKGKGGGHHHHHHGHHGHHHHHHHHDGKWGNNWNWGSGYKYYPQYYYPYNYSYYPYYYNYYPYSWYYNYSK